MSADEASDVTKALAAFGAPAIRYHSFGQAQLRPSSVVLPNLERAALVAEPAVESTLQGAPLAVPGRLTPPMPPPAPPRVHAPLHAPLSPPPRPANPPALEPRVAPPPRPLAEWAAPASPLQGLPVSPPPLSVPAAIPRRAPPVPAAAFPLAPPIPTPPAVAPAPPAPPLVAAAPRAVASLPDPAPKRPLPGALSAPSRNDLVEVFRFLAEGPEATASSQRGLPETFRRA